VGPGWLSPYPAQQCQAVHVGHHYIREDEIRGLDLQEPQRLGDAVSVPNLKSKGVQDIPHDAAKGGFVVDDKDPRHASRQGHGSPALLFA
jgi:hypothetical protein